MESPWIWRFNCEFLIYVQYFILECIMCVCACVCVYVRVCVFVCTCVCVCVCVQGLPFPRQEFNAIDVVMRYLVTEQGFAFEDIIIYAWSIGMIV